MISNKLLDMCRFTCYLFRVTDVQHPRRAPGSFFALPPAPSRLAPNSHGIISFADPYPLTLLESHRFKNMGGRGHLQLSWPPTLKTTSRIRFSFQPLTQCPPCNPFLLIFMHLVGGCRGASVFSAFRRSDLRTFRRVSSLSSFFSHSCALFCTHQNLNPFVFKRFRTLCQKPLGVGGGYTFGKISGGSQRRTMPRRIPRETASVRLPAPSLPRIEAT